jgi:hypothetical protein
MVRGNHIMYFNNIPRNIADKRGDKPFVPSRHILFFPVSDMAYNIMYCCGFQRSEKGQAEYGKGNRDRDNIFYPCGHIVPIALRRDEYMRYIIFSGNS